MTLPAIERGWNMVGGFRCHLAPGYCGMAGVALVRGKRMAGGLLRCGYGVGMT